MVFFVRLPRCDTSDKDHVLDHLAPEEETASPSIASHAVRRGFENAYRQGNWDGAIAALEDEGLRVAAGIDLRPG